MAGGSLIGKIHKAFDELDKLGSDRRADVQDLRRPGDRLQSDHGRGQERPEQHKPVRKPNTIAKSLAIGDPADGYLRHQGHARHRRLGRGRHRCRDRRGDDAAGRTEGIFAETAGGVTVAVTRKLIEQGRILRDEEIVLCITGNGLKTQDAVADVLEPPAVIRPSLAAFEALFEKPPQAVLV